MDPENIFPSFDIDVEGIITAIAENGYRKVLLQGPEGLKRGLPLLAEIIEKGTGARVLIDAEPCFGACDHAGERALAAGADALIHLGHSDIPSMDRNMSVPVHFFHAEMKVKGDMLHAGLKKIVETVSSKRIALFTTVQHISLLDQAKRFLEDHSATVLIGEPGGREAFPGQVLGCSFSAAEGLELENASLLFMGTGRFHPMGLSTSTGKEVHTLDPVTGAVGKITTMERERFLRKRFGSIQKARDLLDGGCMTGILIGSKPGQRRVELASDMADLLDVKGYDYRMIVMDSVAPMKLFNLGLDLVINTACPRIALDDSVSYVRQGIVMITPVELRMALDELPWSEYRFDEEW